MSRLVWIFVAAVLVFAAGVVAWWWTGREFSIGHSDAKLVARGELIYRQHCAACHGAALEGQPEWKSRNERGRLPAPPHDETGHTWHHDDEVLFEVTKYGLGKHAPPGYQSDMPAFGGQLSDDEIIAVLAYIKSRWPDHIHRKRRAAGMT
jgi:mono/diheme cytochrome c family protein